MYKVLIVDDEIFVRKGLISLMDWSSMQYEICGEAENGQQAISMIEQLKPDLVIVDIRMPILDGLGLIKHVKEEGTQRPLFIIVSGYHDFAYAQQALRYNVSDYILKPVDEDELRATLRKLASTLDKNRITTFTGEKPLAESIIETLLQTEHSDEAVEQIATVLNIPAASPYRYVLIEVQDLQVDGPSYLPKLQDLIAERFNNQFPSLPINVRGYSQYGLLIPQSLSSIIQAKNEQEAYMELRSMLEEGLDASVSLYVGVQVNHLKEITLSYTAAVESLNYKFTIAGSGIIFADDIQGQALYYFDVDEELHSKLVDQIEENRCEAYEETVALIFEQFQHKRFAPSAVANTITRSLIGIINSIRKLDGNEEELELLSELLDWQQKYRNLQQLQHIYMQFVQEAAAYIARKRGEQGKGSIEKIKKYIDTHYTENINLKSIAAKFFMNSVYLGQLFRKTYGVYFNEYLLSLRVEEAKRLLRQTDMRMYEVADKVGFQNADYFVTQFEKLEKMTPTDYRNKMLGKN